ncbi:MAG: alpha-L-fucosidase [Clostridia bacterium]|nr:alpha-L-fucosidase [Clostridia bacterium]
MLISRREYDQFTAETREERMAWFKEARLGMFIHYGLFSTLGTGEWAQVQENHTPEEYAKFAANFAPKEGCCDEWCAQAKRMGAKYAVMTTRHHEGFSLWDSKVNPYNSMNACGRDLVREFVDACRKYDLKIGFYSSLMDWHHPDAGTCVFDQDARRRFTDYIEALNVELLSNYGKIDILWYDVPWPMESSESWNSVNRNYRLRQLQPHLIINNRSRMPEDFQTPEESLGADSKYYWEACMTFNGISWGYIDSEQAKQYSYSAGQILKMIRRCSAEGGNLLLNIGPTPDGSVPEEAKAPLDAVGAWMKENGEAAYGRKYAIGGGEYGANNVSQSTVSADEKTVYIWNYSYPKNGKMIFGGYKTAPRRITILSSGKEVKFELEGERIKLYDLPEKCPDTHCGVTVFKMEFDEKPRYNFAPGYRQIHYGRDLKG